jgi:hypothetical protein
VPSAAELLAEPERALELSHAEAAAMLAAVGALEAILRARVATPDSGPEPPLKAPEAAALLGVSERWLRRRALPFRIELSPGRVGYDKAGLLKYRLRHMGR